MADLEAIADLDPIPDMLEVCARRPLCESEDKAASDDDAAASSQPNKTSFTRPSPCLVADAHTRGGETPRCVAT
jgi:hypothetical protein